MNKIIYRLFLLIIALIAAAETLCSCEEKQKQTDENNVSLSSEVKAFMKIAPDEVKNLSEFNILYSDKYYVQIKTTYLMSDMRMKISRDKNKYDIFNETAKTYSHNIIKDGMNYQLFDEKKTYSVSKQKEEPNISFFDMNGNFEYKGVEDGDFNGQNANIYKFQVTLENNVKNELKFVIKDKKLLGVISVSNGFETKMEFEKVSKKLPGDAFSIPDDYTVQDKGSNEL